LPPFSYFDSSIDSFDLAAFPSLYRLAIASPLFRPGPLLLSGRRMKIPNCNRTRLRAFRVAPEKKAERLPPPPLYDLNFFLKKSYPRPAFLVPPSFFLQRPSGGTPILGPFLVLALLN